MPHDDKGIDQNDTSTNQEEARIAATLDVKRKALNKLSPLEPLERAWPY